MTANRARDGNRVEPAVRQFLPPCQIRCPIHEDIQRTNILISLLPNDPEKAALPLQQIGDYLFDHNPFFPVCGYVCGLCETACPYAGTGGAIHRRLLKRFIAENYRERMNSRDPYPSLPPDTPRIAVIGAGPAGIMAGFDLFRRGYRSCLFEAGDEPGGALRLIPHYRLPPEVLTGNLAAIFRIARLELLCSTRFGNEGFDLDKLRRQGFAAIFIAAGSPTPRILTYRGVEVAGQRLAGVVYGHSFLYELSHDAIQDSYLKGRKAIVVGGGNVAFDAARSLRRLGAETVMVCLESDDPGGRDSLPADPNELRGAQEEGVTIICSRGVSVINARNGIFRSIMAPRCLTVYDENGFNPRFDEADTIEIVGDLLVIAVGQGPERRFLRHEGLLDEQGRVSADPVTLECLNHAGVFVGGDMLKIGFMADAMRDGLTAAESIDRFIRKEDLRHGRRIDFSSPPVPIRQNWQQGPCVEWLPPEQRLDFRPFEQGFTLKEAISEAKRCLACGPCLSCKACVKAGIREEIPRIEIDENLCSGCGICMTACPYSAARVVRKGAGLVSMTDPLLCRGCGLCVSACPAGARKLVGDSGQTSLERDH